MNHQSASAGVQIYGGPFSPALAKLRSELKREVTVSWLMITLAALFLTPISYITITASHFILPLTFLELGEFGSQASSASPYETLVGLLALGGQMLGQLAALVLPVGVVLWAVMIYKRNYATATKDLVYGNLALCLADEAFVKVVEEAKRERFRLNPNPVEPGATIVSRVNHFAYHYRQYAQLARGPRELSVPAVIKGNCWVEGSALGLGVCPFCGCTGAIVLIPLALRTILVWPRIIAIKQATIDFLAGKFDGELEQLNQRGA